MSASSLDSERDWTAYSLPFSAIELVSNEVLKITNFPLYNSNSSLYLFYYMTNN